MYLFCIGIGNGVSKTIRLMFSFWYKNHLNDASQAEKNSHTSTRIRFSSIQLVLAGKSNQLCALDVEDQGHFSIFVARKLASSICVALRIESKKIVQRTINSRNCLKNYRSRSIYLWCLDLDCKETVMQKSHNFEKNEWKRFHSIIIWSHCDSLHGICMLADVIIDW